MKLRGYTPPSRESSFDLFQLISTFSDISVQLTRFAIVAQDKRWIVVVVSGAREWNIKSPKTI